MVKVMKISDSAWVHAECPGGVQAEPRWSNGGIIRSMGSGEEEEEAGEQQAHSLFSHCPLAVRSGQESELC